MLLQLVFVKYMFLIILFLVVFFFIVLPEQVMIEELFNYLFVYIVVIIYCVSVDHF